MIKIITSEKNAYPWYHGRGIHMRGYLQLLNSQETVLRGPEAEAYLAGAESFDAFLELLGNVGGVFSIIMEKADAVWAAVDIARSMPLYYAEDLSVLSDGAETVREQLGIAADGTDAYRMAELMAAGVVSGSHTVYKEIRQICMGEAMEITPSGPRSGVYYRHLRPIKPCTKEGALSMVRAAAAGAIRRTLKAVGERPIVLSLSGGYDSRFVACMLKELGVENVSCYTYGREDSFEIRQSKKVAEALGYRWICVTYHEEEIAEQLEGEDLKFIDSFSGHDYSAYLQNYLAVKHLKADGWIPDGAVFLTGLCHDMPTGAYVLEEQTVSHPFTPEGAAGYLMDSRFLRYRLRGEAQARYKQELLEELHGVLPEISSYQEFLQAVDAIETGYIHSRAFLHMNQAHEYFGYEWLLPCWDPELLNMWYSLPAEYRVHQNLYEDWLTGELCAKYGVGTKKTLNTYRGSPRVVRFLKKCSTPIIWLLFHLRIPIRTRTDINGNSLLRQRLYEQIKQKSTLNLSRSGYDILLTVYLMERRYGQRWWRDVKRMLEKVR